MRSLWLLAGVASAYTGLAPAAASFATHARPPAGRSLTRIRCFMPSPGGKPKRVENTAAAKVYGLFFGLSVAQQVGYGVAVGTARLG